MKIIVNIIRAIVGLLFIFSGLIKANDPHGLSYKMQEFFEVWARSDIFPSLMEGLYSWALPFSIIMIALEVVVGVGLLLGKWKNIFVWVLLLLTIFFTFLTGYAVLSGKIATCGCFGDCIPLTAMQSFIKDLILLALVLILLLGKKYIYPVFSPRVNGIILIASLLGVLLFQWYVMRHLPVWDCLPFKVGNNLLELRKMPANAIPDVKEYRFTYEKGGEQKEFSMNELPDSSWTFVSRRDIIIKKGSNNEPPIKDFNLYSLSGEDSTENILAARRDYYLFYVKNVYPTLKQWQQDFDRLVQYAGEQNAGLMVITSNPDDAVKYFHTEKGYRTPILTLDATSFKTAARTDPALYLMHGPIVKEKWGKADLDDVFDNKDQ